MRFTVAGGAAVVGAIVRNRKPGGKIADKRRETGMPAPRVAIIGVPSSAGAHHAGQDLAPAAMREHGFVDRLAAAGVDVEDRGDVAGEVFAVDYDNLTAGIASSVARVRGRLG